MRRRYSSCTLILSFEVVRLGHIALSCRRKLQPSNDLLLVALSASQTLKDAGSRFLLFLAVQIPFICPSAASLLSPNNPRTSRNQPECLRAFWERPGEDTERCAGINRRLTSGISCCCRG